MTTKYVIPEKALLQHIAILGKTGSGKSSVMRGAFIEPLLDAGEPVCIIDPKGDHWGLKSSADGKRAGYPVVIFGGEHADVPLNERAGAHVAELVATGNRPCIIDLGGWMVGERTRFFIDFASTLFKHTRGRRWLLIDECHNFAPQASVRGLDPDAAKMLHWANRLASEGRGKGINLIAASQRPQKVHKDFLTSCETLIAMRAIHKRDRDAIKDWIDGCADPDKGREVLATLANMPRGEGWVWSPEIGFGPKRIRFPLFKTYDSFSPQDVEPGAKLEGWAEVDLDEVTAKLEAVVEEAKANDPKALRARIKELEAAGSAPKALLAEEYKRGYGEGEMQGRVYGYAEAVKQFADLAGRASQSVRDLEQVAAEFEKAAAQGSAPESPSGVSLMRNSDYPSIQETLSDPRNLQWSQEEQDAMRRRNAPPLVINRTRTAPPVAGLHPAGAKMLEALQRNYPAAFSWDEVACLAGMVPGNGYFYGGRKSLLESGLIEEWQGGVRAKERQGQPITHDELVQLWCSKLKSPAPDMLRVIFEHGEITVERLSKTIGKKPGNGYWYRGVAALRNAGLIEQSGNTLRTTRILRI